LRWRWKWGTKVFLEGGGHDLRLITSPFGCHFPAMASAIDALNAVVNNVGWKGNNSCPPCDSVPAASLDSVFSTPRGGTTGNFTEEILNSLGELNFMGIDNEHR
jgi:hypothetical protein